MWIDETDANPVANSIYHNTSGFTHDYYSGTTALASDPTRCLGINAATWATGGPVTKPYDDWQEGGAAAGLLAARSILDGLIARGALRQSWSEPLDAALRAAERAVARGDLRLADLKMQHLASHAASLLAKRRLEEEDARALLASVQAARSTM